MAPKYEKVYREKRHALGEPTKAFVDFFKTLGDSKLKVLDLGCGQGRDALFIARLGHSVTGVDISSTGVKQLLEDAKSEDLQIKAVVTDLSIYQPEGTFDVVVVDRTLHMLKEKERLEVLARIINHVAEQGYILIADEKKNLAVMRNFFVGSHNAWRTIKAEKGILFVQKIN